jgi:hypothetical protein
VGPGADKKNLDWGTVIAQKACGGSSKRSALAAPVTGDPVPNPRYMNPNQAFAAWPTGTFHLSRRLRPDPMEPTTALPSLVRFTTPGLPGELAEARIIELMGELHRRGDGAGAGGGA